eukprot:5378460-Prymnesium_polylepis.1
MRYSSGHSPSARTASVRAENAALDDALLGCLWPGNICRRAQAPTSLRAPPIRPRPSPTRRRATTNAPTCM